MKILVSAFDAFGGEIINPSSLVLEKLNGISGVTLEKIVVPTVFDKAFLKLREKIEEFKPDAVICLGQAAGRKNITVERVAINLRDCKIPDNENNLVTDEKIKKDGENALFSTLDVKAIADAINKKNIPAAVSYTAGTFVCNDLLYLTLDYLKNTDTKCAFIHLPCVPEQLPRMPKDTFALPLDTLVNAVETALETIK